MNEIKSLTERLVQLYPERYVSIGIDCGRHIHGQIEFEYTLYVSETHNIEFKDMSSMAAFIGHLEWAKDKSPDSIDQLLNLN